MALIILQQRFENPNDIDLIIEALKRLPVVAVDMEASWRSENTITLLQREMAAVAAADTNFRFLGTRNLESCLFLLFKITDPVQQKRYFCCHVDDSTDYDWKDTFESFRGSTITLMVMGAAQNHFLSRKKLTLLLQYLLKIASILTIDIIIETQCVLDNFLLKSSDFPQHFTQEFQHYGQRAFKRLFKRELPAEYQQLRFGPEFLTAEPLETSDSSLKIEGTPWDWPTFIMYLSAFDLLTDTCIVFLNKFKSVFAKSEAVFCDYFRRLFSQRGFNAIRYTEASANGENRPRFADFVIDLQTEKLIPVISTAPIGPFEKARYLHAYTPGNTSYHTVYMSESGYQYPSLSPPFLEKFRKLAAPLFKDIRQGVSAAQMTQFVSDIGFGETAAVVPESVKQEIGRIAHEVAIRPHQFDGVLQMTLLKAPKPTEKVCRHLSYLNRLSGVTFYPGGGHKVIYHSEQEGDLPPLQQKLKQFKIEAEIQETFLIISDITQFTQQLSAGVQKNTGFSFKF